MKFMLATVTILAMTTGLANAKTIYYPATACAEIVSAEYSAGNGDTMFEQYEILCKSADGKYTSFIASWGSVAGAFGFGRAFAETEINLVPYDGSELKAD